MNIVVICGAECCPFDLTRHLCPPPLIPNWKMSSHNDANMPTIQCHDRQSLADPPVNKTVPEGHGASVQIRVDAPAPAVARGKESSLRRAAFQKILKMMMLLSMMLSMMLLSPHQATIAMESYQAKMVMANLLLTLTRMERSWMKRRTRQRKQSVVNWRMILMIA